VLMIYRLLNHEISVQERQDSLNAIAESENHKSLASGLALLRESLRYASPDDDSIFSLAAKAHYLFANTFSDPAKNRKLAMIAMNAILNRGCFPTVSFSFKELRDALDKDKRAIAGQPALISLIREKIAVEKRSGLEAVYLTP
jgi:hypothetical protein